MANTTTLEFLLTAVDHASSTFEHVGQQTQQTASHMSKLKIAGGLAMAGVGAAAVKFGKDSVDAYTDAQTQQAKLQGAYKKFPKLADENINSLRDLNSALEAKTGFDDDEAASAQSVLAQYGLTGKQIAQLTPLMEDYAAKTGKDLPAAAKALGLATMGQGRALKAVGIALPAAGAGAKALAKAQKDAGTAADQLKTKQQALVDLQAKQKASGKTTVSSQIALRKAMQDVKDAQDKASGASKNLTAAQKDAAKSGSSFDQVVTGLKDKVGGYATSQAQTAAGKTKVLKAEFGELQETVGQKLVPVLTNLTDVGLKVVNFVSKNSSVLLPLAGAVLTMVVATKAWNAATAAGTAIKTAWTALTVGQAAATEGAADAQVGLNLAMLANPIGLVVLAVIALVAGFVIAYKKSATFRDIVQGAFAGIKKAASAVAAFFTKDVPAAFQKVSGAASTVVSWVKGHWPLLLAILTGPFGLAVLAITKNWGKITSFFGALPGKIKGFFSGAVSWLGGAGSNVVHGLISGVSGAWSSVTSWLGGIPGKITGALSGAASWLHGIGQNVVQGLINGISSLAGSVTSALLDLLPGPLKKFAGKLGIHSPSKVFAGFGANIVQGLVKGLDDNREKAASAIDRIASKIKDTKALKGDSALLSWVKSQGKKLDAAWKKYDQVAAKLSKTSDKLKALRNSKAQMASGIKSAIGGQLDLTQGIGQTTTDANGYTVAGKTTFGSVSGQVKALATKAKKFAGVLHNLVKKGIPAGLVQQIAGMGIDDGIAVGNALLSGTASQIKGLKSDWSELQKYSGQAGNTVGGQAYNGKINDAAAEVKGLRTQEARDKKNADRIADATAKGVVKALAEHGLHLKIGDRDAGTIYLVGKKAAGKHA